MRIKFVRPLQDMVAHANGMVTLRCDLCKPKADVQWLKNGVEVMPSRRYSIRADGAERSLTIHRLSREDAGEYSCESKDDRTVARLRVECKCARWGFQSLVHKDNKLFYISVKCLEWWNSSQSSITQLCWKEKMLRSSVSFPLMTFSWSGSWTMNPSLWVIVSKQPRMAFVTPWLSRSARCWTAQKL